MFEKIINLINIEGNIKTLKCYFEKESFDFIYYNTFIKNSLFESY